MPKSLDIQFLNNKEINKQRWDECINASPNGLIYGRSFYLDNLCPGWYALAGENYEWVLPITHKTKWRISYLYQPPFTQQLGIFAKANVMVPFKEIILWLKHHYKFWEINWNYATDTHFVISPVQVTAATNFILNLSESYESIAENYHKILIKNLKRSKRLQLIYNRTEDYNKCINLYRKYYGNRISHVKLNDYIKFSNICCYALQHKMLECRQALDNDGELLAVVLLLFDGRRLYNIMNVTTEAGRKTEANHFLLDAVIREFSGKELWFDFEGSDLPGVKAFYKYFGPVNQPFYMLKFNDLHWPLRLFKD